MKEQHWKFNIYIRFLVLTIVVCACGEDPTSVTNGSAKDNEVLLRDYQLSSDETWDSEKTYIVHGTLQIPPDVVLEILPGTEVKFANSAHIRVRGKLKVGTSLSQFALEELVHLTSNNVSPEPGDWKGILFDFTHDAASFLRGTVVEYAEIALDIKTTSPSIVDCTLRHNKTAIALDGSDSRIQYNAIHENEIGISTIERQNRPQIEQNNIYNNKTGILCENVQSIIQFNNFENNDFALRLNVKFNLGIPNNWWGTLESIEIDKLILDSHDTDIITKPLGTVDYMPIAETRFTDAGPRE